MLNNHFKTQPHKKTTHNHQTYTDRIINMICVYVFFSHSIIILDFGAIRKFFMPLFIWIFNVCLGVFLLLLFLSHFHSIALRQHTIVCASMLQLRANFRSHFIHRTLNNLMYFVCELFLSVYWRFSHENANWNAE